MQWGRRTVFSISGAVKMIATCKRMKLDHHLTPYSKTNSKWIKDSNVTRETIKLLEENIGGKLLDMGLGDGFLNFGVDAKRKDHKSKDKQVGPHHTKKLLHSKGKHQQYEKTTYEMKESICKSYTW